MCIIRNATPADIDAIVELGRVMQAEGPGFQKLTYSPARVKNFMSGMVASPDALVLVGQSGANVVACFAGYYAQQWWSEDYVTCDFGLFVHPDYRGGTTAMRLLRKYREWAVAKGAKLINLGISSGVTTEKTMMLFERVGFKISSYGFEA